jgi:predicted nucleic acid-binding protein
MERHHRGERGHRVGATVCGIATLAASYGLLATVAVHLATAVNAGADRFVTNNMSDYPKTITEIDITYPEDLPDPATP